MPKARARITMLANPDAFTSSRKLYCRSCQNVPIVVHSPTTLNYIVFACFPSRKEHIILQLVTYVSTLSQSWAIDPGVNI